MGQTVDSPAQLPLIQAERWKLLLGDAFGVAVLRDLPLRLRSLRGWDRADRDSVSSDAFAFAREARRQ